MIPGHSQNHQINLYKIRITYSFQTLGFRAEFLLDCSVSPVGSRLRKILEGRRRLDIPFGVSCNRYS